MRNGKEKRKIINFLKKENWLIEKFDQYYRKGPVKFRGVFHLLELVGQTGQSRNRM